MTSFAPGILAARSWLAPMLIGIYSPADALALLDHQLDRIFR
jgi:hypothetical protein